MQRADASANNKENTENVETIENNQQENNEEKNETENNKKMISRGGGAERWLWIKSKY